VIWALFAITPSGDFSILVEIDDPNLWPIPKIKRDERFAHVQVLNPGLAFARHLDIIRLAVHGDDLILGHTNFGVFLFLLCAAALSLIADAAADEKSAGEKNEDSDIHVCPLDCVVGANSSCDISACQCVVNWSDEAVPVPISQSNAPSSRA